MRLTLLNRLNSSTEWAGLPLSCQTPHHDWPSGYRGLLTPLFVLSLGIELAHSFNLKCQGLIPKLGSTMQSGSLFRLTELAGLSANRAAAELNRRGVATPQGGQWHALSVIRLRQRLA